MHLSNDGKHLNGHVHHNHNHHHHDDLQRETGYPEKPTFGPGGDHPPKLELYKDFSASAGGILVNNRV